MNISLTLWKQIRIEELSGRDFMRKLVQDDQGL